jgi:hypothetical protein
MMMDGASGPVKLIAIGIHGALADIARSGEATGVAVGSVFVSALAVPHEQPISDRDLLLRVAGIRSVLLESATYIAVRYGAAFSSAEELQKRFIGRAAEAAELLRSRRGCVEMTMKMPVGGAAPPPDRRYFQNGADYLRALQVHRNAAQLDPAFRARVEERLSPLAVEYRWRPRDAGSMELVALIAREEVDRFRAAAESLRDSKQAFLLSGPWPLEVFGETV